MLCGPTPEGQGRWTFLAEQMVEKRSHETVRQTLKKNSKPWNQSWVIKPEKLPFGWKMYSMFIPVLTTLITGRLFLKQATA